MRVFDGADIYSRRNIGERFRGWNIKPEKSSQVLALINGGDSNSATFIYRFILASLYKGEGFATRFN